MGGGASSLTGDVQILSTSESDNTGSGALVVMGGVGIQKHLNVTGDSSVAGIVSLTNGFESTGTASGTLVVTGGVGVSGRLNTGDVAMGPAWSRSNTEAATSSTDGALRVVGGVSTQSTLYVGNDSHLLGSLRVEDTTDASSVSTGISIHPGGVGIGKQPCGRHRERGRRLYRALYHPPRPAPHGRCGHPGGAAVQENLHVAASSPRSARSA